MHVQNVLKHSTSACTPTSDYSQNKSLHSACNSQPAIYLIDIKLFRVKQNLKS